VPLTTLIVQSVPRTARLSRATKWGLALAFVAVALGLRLLLLPIWPSGGFPFLFFFGAILAASALGDGGAGYVATGASSVASLWFVPPLGSPGIEAQWVLPWLVFSAQGLAIACVVETLHHALARASLAAAEAQQAERARALLLDEYRHRSRNDLQSLVAVLRLQARNAEPACRAGLLRGAAHALALARVHHRMTLAAASPDGGQVDTARLVHGLADDLAATLAGEALRPIAVVVDAEAHRLSSERSVQLGLVLHETLAAALAESFPDGRPGIVRVDFRREIGCYALTIADDGAGLPPGDAFGARLLAGLAGQLRGSFTRQAGERGGTVAALRFPVREPGS